MDPRSWVYSQWFRSRENHGGGRELASQGWEGMIFHRLEVYEGIFGPVESIKVEEYAVFVTIAGITLKYPQLSREGKFLMKHLGEDDVGSRIGIMNCGKCFRIRWYDPPKSRSVKDPFVR